MFSGIWIPLVTPFHHGQVDTAALRRLVRHYQGAGVSGFVALGTTGEAVLLSQIERYTVLEAIADACGDRTPFLIGIGAADTREVCAQIRAESGVPIIMLTAKSDTTDVVRGLESGADDYVV